MVVYKVASAAEWNQLVTITAQIPLTGSDTVRLSGNLTFAAVPSVLVLGAATLNGDNKTVTLQSTSTSTGYVSLAGGTVRNLNVVCTGNAADMISMLLTNSSYGTVQYVSMSMSGSGNVFTTGSFGGIIGTTSTTAGRTLTIDRCSSAIVATKASTAGGFVGVASKQSSLTISRCFGSMTTSSPALVSHANAISACGGDIASSAVHFALLFQSLFLEQTV
jgi:hypothetical protein